MKEIHGIPDAMKMSVAGGDTQAVTVIDGKGVVILSLSASSYPAGMKPVQARLIARQLNASATRVEMDERLGDVK